MEHASPAGEGPVFQPGCVYTESYVLSRCGISKRTLQRWKLAGLKSYRPGTKQSFYFAEDLMAIMRLSADDLPAYRAGYTEGGAE